MGEQAAGELNSGWLQGDLSRRQRLLIALVSVGIAAALTVTPLLAPFEDWSLDQRLSLRGEQAPNPAVVVVAINQPSLDALGERWPIRRRRYAKLIDRLSAGGAKVIAFDTQFDEATDNADDTPMIEAMRKAGNVVLAAEATRNDGETTTLGGTKAQQYARVRVGMANQPADYDKIIRHFEWTIQGVPTLPLEVSRRFGRPPDRAAFHNGRAWLEIRGRPCAPDIPASCAIPTYGFSDVLNMSALRAREAFEGKVVVVGATASGTSSPVSVWGPGNELTSRPHFIALEIATALQDFPLRQAAWQISVLFLLAGGFLPVALDALGRRTLGSRREPRNALNGRYGALLTATCGILGIALLSAIAVWSFDRGVVIPVGAPLLAAFLATSLSVVQRYQADTINAQRLYDAVDSVVPRAYVGELIARCAHPQSHKTPQDHKAQAERGTVIFVDIYGLTVITAALLGQVGKTSEECATDVHRMISKFQELVIDEVFNHHGVIVDLMGDGVLAAFGIVSGQKDKEVRHEDLALLTAHGACTRVVRSMRDWIKSEGWQGLVAAHRDRFDEKEGTDEFEVQVGLDSGKLTFGLIGHKARFEFSVIGLATIRASRLKDKAKDLKVTLCVSEDTYNHMVSTQTRELVAATSGGEVELRGLKGQPISIYTWKRNGAEYGRD